MQWYLKVIKNYVNFNGRAHRTEYWMFTLIDTLIIIGLFIAMFATMSGSMMDYDPYDPYGSSETSSPFYYVYLLYTWGLMLPRIGVLVRRLHDTDRAGWWLLISFVPLVGGIVLLIFTVTAGTDGPNQYGDDPWDEDYDDEYYDDEYEDEYYDDEPAPQAPLRRRSQQTQQRQPQRGRDDIYDLNESFKRDSSAGSDRRGNPSPEASSRRKAAEPRDELAGYKNPFNADPNEDKNKNFDRFGLVDDNAPTTSGRQQQRPEQSQRPSGSSDRSTPPAPRNRPRRDDDQN